MHDLAFDRNSNDFNGNDEHEPYSRLGEEKTNRIRVQILIPKRKEYEQHWKL